MRKTPVERVIVFPMSGYVNRLQAMASGAILAEDLGAGVRYCWTPFPLVPGGPQDVFAPAFVDSHFLTPSQALDDIGLEVDDIPRYVGSDAERGIAWLRGHDLGEQALLPALTDVLATSGPLRVLVIVAGGSFGFGDSAPFLVRKQDWYQRLALHPDVEQATREARQEHLAPYLGLHLRYTDRSLQSPSDRAIESAITRAVRDSGLTSLFIAADTPEVGERWAGSARRLGLHPWTVPHDTVDRTDPRSAHAALVDWRLLGSAERLVYFAASSFATEAVCAAGSWNRSIALRPTPLRRAHLRSQALMHAGGRRMGALINRG